MVPRSEFLLVMWILSIRLYSMVNVGLIRSVGTTSLSVLAFEVEFGYGLLAFDEVR